MRYLKRVNDLMAATVSDSKQQKIGYVALVVRDYDEAIEFYRQKLGFILVEDTPIDGKRWVLMSAWFYRDMPAARKSLLPRTSGSHLKPDRRPRLSLPAYR